MPVQAFIFTDVRVYFYNLNPMHELPVEILVMIFKEVVRQATRSVDRYTSLFRLMLVCRRCRNIILRNVAFWSHITASDEESIPLALKSIDRSGDSKLSVCLTWHSLVTAEQMVVPLLKLADQSHRLIKFSIISPSIPTVPRWVSPATNLRTLVIRNKGVQQPLVDFFGGPLPQLRYLALEGFCSWPAGLFRDLYYITLQLPSASGTASFTGLLDLLASSPGLRSLNIGGWVSTPRPHHSSRVITLPHLTSLTIFKSSSRGILSHMSLPNGVEVRLVECMNIVGGFGSGLFPGPRDSALSCLAGLFTLRVTSDARHSTLSIMAFKQKKSIPTLVIKNKITPQFNHTVVQSLEDYATNPAFASVEVLSVVADTSLQMPWYQWLSSFRSLRQLMIRTRNTAALCTMLHKEFGCDPVLYPTPKQTLTQDSRGMGSLHIDWRATLRRMHYHCAFGGVLHVEPRKKAGLVPYMKPRGAAVLGGGVGTSGLYNR